MDFRKDIGAVVFRGTLGGLGIIRSLGRQGIPVIGVDSSRWAYGLLSRYCSQRVMLPAKALTEESLDEAAALDALIQLGRTLPSKYVLYPTSDQIVLFVSRHRDELQRYYYFNFPEHQLLEDLISKRGMYQIALQHSLPTPKTCFPENERDVIGFSETVMYPCLLKSEFSHSPLKRVKKRMVKVASAKELIDNYRSMATIDRRIMIQEYIPGEDYQMYLYDAYLNAQSEPQLVFTGRKLRQAPINYGSGCLCECETFPEFERLVTAFCKAIGYRGLVDIGLKLDVRDRKFKVLDINPRIGQNFRTFVTRREKIDLALAHYLDLTGQAVAEREPFEKRRWIIEDSDILSSIRYYRTGRLSAREWITSFRGVQECAFFNLRDPLPWMFRYVEYLVSPLWLRIKRLLPGFLKRDPAWPGRAKA